MTSHDVIMPALGMAQDTGRLVRWLKPPGAPVCAGEALFEVETDKAVMEVEAQAEGWLGEIRVSEGEAVPVGSSIARILTAAPGEPGAGPVLTPIRHPESPASVPASRNAPSVPGPAVTRSDRVFASPRLRRLAQAEGLNIRILADAGHPPPFHAADLLALRLLAKPAQHQLPGQEDRVASASEGAVVALSLTARVARAPSLQFLNRLRSEAGIDLPESTLWLAFAAAALRGVRPGLGDIVIAYYPVGKSPRRFRNPDRGRLSGQTPELEAGPGDQLDPEAPGLILRDLSDSRITGFRLRPTPGLQLGMAARGDTLEIALDCNLTQLSEADAMRLIEGLAARLDDPLLHLV